VDDISQAGDVVLALLDDSESEDGQVGTDDASADTLTLALAVAAGAVAGVAGGEQQTDTTGRHDTLLHREALLVVATSDPEDVALEFVAQAVGRDLLAHSSLHEDAELALIVNFDQLLRPVGRVGNVQLHRDERSRIARKMTGLKESRVVMLVVVVRSGIEDLPMALSPVCTR
jgi:hypothetical protein